MWICYQGAKMIVAGGERFPRTVAQLRKVPGIGEYTAGAIASIAFREVRQLCKLWLYSQVQKTNLRILMLQVVPAVDGNVIRVLARLKAISANPKDSITVKKFWWACKFQCLFLFTFFLKKNLEAAFEPDPKISGIFVVVFFLFNLIPLQLQWKYTQTSSQPELPTCLFQRVQKKFQVFHFNDITYLEERIMLVAIFRTFGVILIFSNAIWYGCFLKRLM